MKACLTKVKRILDRVLGLFPSPLPLGMTDFHKWADSIVSLYDLPDNDSTRFALATMILHTSSPTTARKAKWYFALCIKKSMANQIAAAVMKELKEKQEAQARAQINPPAEVTEPSQGSNGPKQ